MTMVTQLIERRKAKHGYSWGHRSSSFLCSSLSGGRRYSEGYRKRDWATMQKSSHKTFDLEASRLIICAAKIREPSINAFVLLSAQSFAFSSSLFWMGLLTSVSPMKKPSTSCCLHFFIMMDCNLELSAKERLSSLNCCCWVLDSSNREQNWNLVCRQQDEGMWKKMLFYYHGWQLQEKARECLGHPRQ